MVSGELFGRYVILLNRNEVHVTESLLTTNSFVKLENISRAGWEERGSYFNHLHKSFIVLSSSLSRRLSLNYKIT